MLDTGTYIWNTGDRLWERYSDPVYPGDMPVEIPGIGWGGDNQATTVAAWYGVTFPDSYSDPKWASYRDYGEIASNPTDGYIPAADHNRYSLILIPPGFWGMGAKGGIFLPCVNSNHVIGSSWQAHIFSFDTRKWSRVGDNRAFVSPKIGTSGCMDGSGNIYHWEGDTYAIRRLLHNASTWSTLTISNLVSTFGVGVGAMVWVPGSYCKNTAGALVMLSGRTGGTFDTRFSVINLDSGSLSSTMPGEGNGLTGTQPVVGGSDGDDGAGLIWVADLGALAFWSPANDSVYAIYPPTSPFTQNWTCSVLASSNTPSIKKAGIPNFYNKFQYAPALRAFFVVGNAYDDDMWCFRPAEVQLPQWAPTTSQFANASTALPSTVDPCPTNTCIYSANSGFSSIWTAWNGGAYAPNLGAYGSMLFFGGGHYAYYGNEVVRFDIETRSWLRMSEPALYGSATPGWSDDEGVAPNTVVGPYGAYPNGTPYPFHTNMGCDFLPSDAGGGSQGSYVFISHDQTGVQCSNACRIWRFDLALRTWSVSNPISNFNFGDGSQQRNGICYDSKRKGIWSVRFSGGGGIAFYSFLTGVETIISLTSFNPNITSMQGGILEYHQGRDFLLVPHSTGTSVIDLSSYTLGVGSAPIFEIGDQMTGTACPTMVPPAYDRPAYCSYDGNFYLLDWSSKTVAKLYKLTVPADLQNGAWAWSNETLTAKNSEALAVMPVSGGRTSGAALYGRFRYVPTLKAFLWSDGEDLHAQLGRPSNFT
jgi:hypothetical protein